jgi:hypothetical protein
MSLFDRDMNKPMDSPGDAPRDTPASSGSNSDADDSAAHIAELVRRTGERDARQGTSFAAALPDKTTPQPQRPVTTPPAPQHSAQPVNRRVVQPLLQRLAQVLTLRVVQPAAAWVRPRMRKPPWWALAAGGTVAAVLIATGFALSQPSSSRATPPPGALPTSAPPADVVRTTDVITDCAGHSHGRTKKFFETQNCVKATRSLTTGRVNGRPALFVVSRIQMTSPDAAASIKQVLDANGTGNLNDLLREGKTYPGAPEAMPDSGYASVQKGATILVAEAGFTDGGLSSNTNPALRAAAAQMAGR